MANEELSLSEVLQIRRDKLDKLKETGKNPFDIVRYNQTHHSKDIKDNFEAMEGKEVAIRRGRSCRRLDPHTQDSRNGEGVLRQGTAQRRQPR